MVQLGLEHGCDQREKQLIKVGKACLMTCFLAGYKLHRKDNFALYVEDWMS